ncbi:RICIN domain-containing protein [Streptacidiphilus sp. EB129]|jgi:hypothetical protein|uniref:RICIN domain-containing protein n=1 Tax=Streptacidiphilus sp. EB129 TaxID=3156262 RepID=UPI003516FBBE
MLNLRRAAAALAAVATLTVLGAAAPAGAATTSGTAAASAAPAAPAPARSAATPAPTAPAGTTGGPRTIHVGSLTITGTLTPLSGKQAKARPMGCCNPVGIVNYNSGKCLETYHSATNDGATVDQWDCNGSNTQLWYQNEVSTYAGYPVYTLQNSNSFECLEVYHSAQTNGSKVDQWSCNGTQTQEWIYISINGSDKYVNVNTGKLLEVYNSSTADGAAVDQWTDNGSATQHWHG